MSASTNFSEENKIKDLLKGKHPEYVMGLVVTGKVMASDSNYVASGEQVEFTYSCIEWPSKDGMDGCISINGLYRLIMGLCA